MALPLMDTHAQWEPHLARVKEAILAVVDSGRYILGPEGAAFELEAAAMLGCGHAVGVGNGTDAISIALRALAVGPGDEVICPSYTFYATAEAAAAIGAVPVFVDLAPGTFTIDPDAVAAAMTPRTRAVIAVHLFGHPADMPRLREVCDAHGVALIEDAAQAFGADGVATIGDAATFSFYPSKNLSTLGDGGLITTPRADVAERCRVLRFHGTQDKKTFTAIGWNSRLDEIHAAILRVFLGPIGGWNAARVDAAARYATLGLGAAVTLPPATGVYHLYVVRAADRDRVAAACRGAEVATGVFYATPLHRQPVFANLPPRDLPETDRAAREGLALPMFPTLTEADQRRVVEAVASASAPVA
jgi:dTDP-4-amino-4,6-dideoxygalactose transaminase